MAEGEHQRRRDQDDRHQLEQVAPGRRVLERVRRIHAEEAAAVGAKLLDGDLAGCRAERDALPGALQGGGVGVVEIGLRHALPDQQQRQQQAQRQQSVEGRTGQVDPEVAEILRRLARNAARQRHQHSQADGGADEVLHGQPGHLAQVAQRRLAAVGLPVGVGDEADGGVQRQRPFQPRQVLRIERQRTLQQKDGEQQRQPRQVERQQGQGVGLPVLLAVRVDAAGPVDQALRRLQERAEECPPAFHDLVVEAPEERRRHQYQREEGQDQQDVVAVHGGP
ncbi:hypothetical protein D9M71_194940 [compost metagenome]